MTKRFIADRLRELVAAGADLLITTGGMSVDPDDVTRFAIRSIGATDITYGSAVLPGAMVLVGYIENNGHGDTGTRGHGDGKNTNNGKDGLTPVSASPRLQFRFSAFRPAACTIAQRCSISSCRASWPANGSAGKNLPSSGTAGCACTARSAVIRSVPSENDAFPFYRSQKLALLSEGSKDCRNDGFVKAGRFPAALLFGYHTLHCQLQPIPAPFLRASAR